MLKCVSQFYPNKTLSRSITRITSPGSIFKTARLNTKSYGVSRCACFCVWDSRGGFTFNLNKFKVSKNLLQTLRKVIYCSVSHFQNQKKKFF